MTLVLVVDDVAPLAEQYAYDLRRTGGYEVLTAPTGEKALETLGAAPVDCVVLDLEMPGMDGFEVLRALERKGSQVPVIVYTGMGSYDRCVQAVRLGAYGFIDKAEPMERVVHEIESALERSRLRAENSALRRQLGRETSLVGGSAAMTELRATIAKVAPVPSQVLIVGESGSGKELVARDLHRFGPQPSGPFIAINCAALPESLVESELFGHERGAFTGAIRTRIGRFELARGGTLLLDEIGDMPLAMQAKILRALEERKITRVGSDRSIEVDVRIIAATNHTLSQLVDAGRFRADLFYRLRGIQLRLPALRERLDDLPELIDAFLDRARRKLSRTSTTLSNEALQCLWAYGWPGNVRELKHVLEGAVLLCDGVILPEHLPPAIQTTSLVHDRGPADSRTLDEAVEDVERRMIMDALERTRGVQVRAARVLGITEQSLWYRMKKYGIQARSGAPAPPSAVSSSLLRAVPPPWQSMPATSGQAKSGQRTGRA